MRLDSTTTVIRMSTVIECGNGNGGKNGERRIFLDGFRGLVYGKMGERRHSGDIKSIKLSENIEIIIYVCLIKEKKIQQKSRL